MFVNRILMRALGVLSRDLDAGRLQPNEVHFLAFSHPNYDRTYRDDPQYMHRMARLTIEVTTYDDDMGCIRGWAMSHWLNRKKKEAHAHG